MRPIFGLPGRSSIDCLASWVGDGSIGILLTNKQFLQGFYTKREACVIATNFSMVSITFCVVILSYVKLQHLTVPFYFVVFFTTFICAIICPKLPPLSKVPDDFVISDSNSSHLKTEKLNSGFSFSYSLNIAKNKAQKACDIKMFISQGSKNVLDMWFGVLPVVLSFGFIALFLNEYTQIFTFLGSVFIPLLNLLQIPEADAAAPCLVVGFADMFLPVILASKIDSELTRFIVASISVTQLIFMSEVGSMILSSKIPLGFFDLLFIFIQRTLLSLFIVVSLSYFII